MISSARDSLIGNPSDSVDLFGLSPDGRKALQRARAGDLEAFGIVCLELENAFGGKVCCCVPTKPWLKTWSKRR